MSYISEFLSLDCAGDILNIVSPLHKSEKEITESMAIITRVRDEVLQKPMKYNVVDLCAGNALTSITSVFLLPVSHAVAIDKYKRNRNYTHARRFEYVGMDIYCEDVYKYIDRETILISVHPCRSLAIRVLDIFLRSHAKSVYLMPCCAGRYEIPMKRFLLDRLGRYHTWCYYLASRCNGDISIDDKCLSEKNAIITVHRR